MESGGGLREWIASASASIGTKIDQVPAGNYLVLCINTNIYSVIRIRAYICWLCYLACRDNVEILICYFRVRNTYVTFQLHRAVVLSEICHSCMLNR